MLLAVPPVDFVLHNSLFLVAHFHNVMIGGVCSGLGGLQLLVPKAFGFTLDEGLGQGSFWCWFIGFYLAFMPLYLLGLMGMTRRMQHIDDPAGGRCCSLPSRRLRHCVGIACQIVQLLRQHPHPRPAPRPDR